MLQHALPFPCTQHLITPRRSGQHVACAASSHDALLPWLQSEGVPAQKVAIHEGFPEGRGLIACSSIMAGERLLSIPQHLIMTPDAARESSAVRELLEAYPDLPDWSVLAVLLAETRRQGAGHASKWGPYVASLPTHSGGCLEWSAEEVDMLQGSHAIKLASLLRRTWGAAYEALEPLLNAGRQQGLLQPSVDRAALRWAFSMLVSRLFRLSNKEGLEVLVPWADMLNHSPSARCLLDWDPDARAVVFRTDQPYQKGEQVWNSYGTKTSGQLLCQYGFLPAPGSNPHDAVLLRIALDEKDPMYPRKALCLAKHDLEPSMDFPVKLDGLPQQLLPYAAFAAAPIADAADIEPLASYLFEEGGYPRIDGKDTERMAWDAVSAACKQLLAGFPTTLQSDQDALERLLIGRSRKGEAASPRAADILRLRIQERRILNKTVFSLQQQRSPIKM